MDNKRIFEEPLCEILTFSVEDMIASSGFPTSWDTDEFAFND